VWQVCVIVFVIPIAIFVALALLEILILGGEDNDPGRESSQDPPAYPRPTRLVGAVRARACQRPAAHWNEAVAVVADAIRNAQADERRWLRGELSEEEEWVRDRSY
jgi:hypothetical protein